MGAELVSVIIPTYNRAELLVNRALPSVFNQTHQNLDIHVVGDGTDEATVEAMKAFPQVRFTNLPHAEYFEDQHRHWGWQGLPAVNYGLDHAKGDYISCLADDDEMYPHNIEILLKTLHEKDVDFVYGISETYKNNQYTGQRYGSYPPGDAAFCGGSFVYKASLPYRYDPDCFSRGLTGDADMWIRMYQGGVKFHFLKETVLKYHRNFP